MFQRYRLEHYTISSNWLALASVILFGVLSLSRSVALFRGDSQILDFFYSPTNVPLMGYEY